MANERKAHLGSGSEIQPVKLQSLPCIVSIPVSNEPVALGPSVLVFDHFDLVHIPNAGKEVAQIVVLDMLRNIFYKDFTRTRGLIDESFLHIYIYIYGGLGGLKKKEFLSRRVHLYSYMFDVVMFLSASESLIFNGWPKKSTPFKTKAFVMEEGS